MLSKVCLLALQSPLRGACPHPWHFIAKKVEVGRGGDTALGSMVCLVSRPSFLDSNPPRGFFPEDAQLDQCRLLNYCGSDYSCVSEHGSPHLKKAGTRPAQAARVVSGGVVRAVDLYGTWLHGPWWDSLATVEVICF